jgi:hypothetical protein
VAKRGTSKRLKQNENRPQVLGRLRLWRIKNDGWHFLTEPSVVVQVPGHLTEEGHGRVRQTNKTGEPNEEMVLSWAESVVMMP